MKQLKRLIFISMLLAAAIVINYLETFIPVFIPGVRLGLANVIILIMIYEFKFYEALAVDILRVLVVSLIRGTFLNPVFFMSLSGALLSFVIMLIFSKIKIFTSVSASLMGSLFHGFGQIIVAAILMSTINILYYLPVILSLNILTGVLSGFITDLYLRRSITHNYINVKEYGR